MGTFWQNLIKKSLKFGHLGHFFFCLKMKKFHIFSSDVAKKKKEN